MISSNSHPIPLPCDENNRERHFNDIEGNLAKREPEKQQTLLQTYSNVDPDDIWYN